MTDEIKDIDANVTIDAADVVPEEMTPESADDNLRTQLAEMSDKYLRTAAELENTRRRGAVDAQNMARARAMGIADNFIPLIDAIAAALKHTPDDDGILAMQAAANAALEKSGITKIKSVGEILNPALHNAVSTESETGMPPNTITTELQTGYLFGDAVLRTAMVVVAK